LPSDRSDRLICVGPLLNLFRPEANSVCDPSLGARTDAEAEAMTNTAVLSIFHFGAQSAQRSNPPHP
jgi:hypothetical protein